MVQKRGQATVGLELSKTIIDFLGTLWIGARATFLILKG
jgi:hypothetical protein